MSRSGRNQSLIFAGGIRHDQRVSLGSKVASSCDRSQREMTEMLGIGFRCLVFIAVGLCQVAPALADEIGHERQASRPFLRPNAVVPAGRLQSLVFQQQDGRLLLAAAAADHVIRRWEVKPTLKALVPRAPLRGPVASGRMGRSCDLICDPLGRLAAGIMPIARSSSVFFGRGRGNWKGLPVRQFPSDVLWTSLAFQPRHANSLVVAYTCANSTCQLVVWDLSRSPPQAVQSITPDLSWIDTLRISPEGDRLAAVDFSEGEIRLWSVDRQQGRLIENESKVQLETQFRDGSNHLLKAFGWLDRHGGFLASRGRRLEFDRAVDRVQDFGRWPALINFSNSAVDCQLGMGSQWRRLGPGRATLASGEKVKVNLRGEFSNRPEIIGDRQPYTYTLRTQPGQTALEFGIVELVVATATAPRVGLAAAGLREAVPNARGKVLRDTPRVRSVVLIDCSQAQAGGHRRNSYTLLEQGVFSHEIHCLTFSPDGRYLAAAGLDRLGDFEVNRIKVWDVANRKLIAEFPKTIKQVDGGLPIAMVQVAPDGGGVRFAWGRDLVSIERNQAVLEGKSSPTHGLDFERGIEKDSKLVRARFGQHVEQRWVFERDPSEMSFKLISLGQQESGAVGLFPLLVAGQMPRAAVRFRSGRRDCVALARHRIEVFDVGQSPPRLVRVFVGHEGEITSLDVWTDPRTPAANWLLSGASDGTICGWSLEGLEREPAVAPFRGKDQTHFLGELALHVTSSVVQGRRRTDVLAHELGLGYTSGLSRDEPQPVRGLEIRDGNRIRRVSPAQWRQALVAPRPGTDMRLTVGAMKTQGDRTVVIPVSHPPLWTLYPMVDGHWIIWANTGEFLASDRTGKLIERRFGWHSNAVDAGGGLVARWQDARERWSEHHNFNDINRRLNDRLAVSGRLETHFPSKITFVSRPQAGELQQPRDFEVALRVTQALDGEIDEVQLWCNGYLLHKQSTPELGDLEQDGSLLLRVSVPARIQRLAQENKLTARVINRFSNGEQGGAEPIEWSFRVNGPLPRRRVHYLGVGVTDLDHGDINGNRPLEYAANDAAYLGRALKQQLSWDTGVFQILVDKKRVTGSARNQSMIEPTKQNIGRAFVEMLDIVRPDDLLVVLVATHGEMADGKIHLMARDSRDTRSHPENRGSWFSSDELTNWLSQLPCACLLLVDACHSGGLDLADETFDFGPGPHVFVSSRNNQASFEAADVRRVDGQSIGHGLFTGAVIDGLSRLERGDQGQMAWHQDVESLNQLPGYVMRRVPDLLKTLMPAEGGEEAKSQHPKLLPSTTFPDRVGLKPVGRQPEVEDRR